ncbi:YecR family lipoprotein [Dinoroseobacter shibae]|uniref:YecR family lipoprotein n=1 Tax=Dinoroseobacter shibae TaxID=215813 RepID=UPI0005C6001C
MGSFRIFGALCLVTVVGCTEVTKVPVPTGGSRADASVTLSYNTNPYEIVTPDWETAQSSANARCQAWGYSRAEPFEGVQTQCQAFDGWGNCSSSVVSRTYQCLGRG